MLEKTEGRKPVALLQRAEEYLQEREIRIAERCRLLDWQAELILSGEWERIKNESKGERVGEKVA